MSIPYVVHVLASYIFGGDYWDKELYSFLEIRDLGDELGIKIMSQLHM